MSVKWTVCLALLQILWFVSRRHRADYHSLAICKANKALLQIACRVLRRPCVLFSAFLSIYDWFLLQFEVRIMAIINHDSSAHGLLFL